MQTKRIIVSTAAGTVVTFYFIGNAGIVAEAKPLHLQSNTSTEIARKDRLVNAFWQNRIDNIKEKVKNGELNSDTGEKMIEVCKYKMANAFGKPGEFARHRIERSISKN